jgi:hypothetical protein
LSIAKARLLDAIIASGSNILADRLKPGARLAREWRGQAWPRLGLPFVLQTLRFL